MNKHCLPDCKFGGKDESSGTMAICDMCLASYHLTCVGLKFTEAKRFYCCNSYRNGVKQATKVTQEVGNVRLLFRQPCSNMAPSSLEPKSSTLVQKPEKLQRKFKNTSCQRKGSFQNAYKATACILKDVYDKKGHVKTLIYQSNYWDKRHLLYLVVNTLKNKEVIDKVIKKSKLKAIDNSLTFTEVIVFELLFGRGKVQPFSKSVQSIQKAKKTLLRALKNITSGNPDLIKPHLLKTQEFLPKYARVNTLLSTVSETLLALRKERIGQVKYIRDETTFEEFLTKVQNLRKNAFIIDYHFPDLLVFHPSQALYTSNVFKQGFLKISDKASYFPVKMLSPPPGCTAMDPFAAPGMKTCLMASFMNNKGLILASDWKVPRVEVMKKILGSSGVTCCQVQCQNFLEINPYEKPYQSVEYALVDPSCSSSGMVGRLSEFLGEKDGPEKIEALMKFQISALKHAMSFPNIKRIAYSTCSVNVEENEKVVEAALAYFPEQYQVVDMFPEWSERGYDTFSFGSKCVRAFPKKHLTNGFFVAVLQRLEDVPLKVVLPNELHLKGRKRRKNSKMVEAEVSEEEDEVQDSQEVKSNSDEGIKSLEDLDEDIKSLEDSDEDIKSLEDADEDIKSLEDSDEDIKSLEDSDEDIKSLEGSNEDIKSLEDSNEDIKLLEDLGKDNSKLIKLKYSESEQRSYSSDSENSVSSKEIESMILLKKNKMENPAIKRRLNSFNINKKPVLKLKMKKQRNCKFVVTEM